MVELVVRGEKVLPNDQAKGAVVFKGDGFRFVITANGEADFTRTSATFRLDPAKSPGTIDATLTAGENKDRVMLGIYELDRDDLKLCLSNQRTAGRPSAFTGEGEFVLFKLKRSKK